MGSGDGGWVILDSTLIITHQAQSAELNLEAEQKRPEKFQICVVSMVCTKAMKITEIQVTLNSSNLLGKLFSTSDHFNCHEFVPINATFPTCDLTSFQSAF